MSAGDGSVAATAVSSAWNGAGEPAISVLIPTHGRAALLGALVAALERQSMPRDSFEVIVVDDASPDDTWPVLTGLAEATPLRMKAARLATNGGPAVARNAAAALARGPLLAFTDDDCVPAKEWLAALDAALQAGTAVVQGRTLPLPAEADAAGPWARSVWVTEPSWLFETCNLGVRRSAFDAAGGFGTDRPDATRATRAHFGEDAELGWRVVAGGGSSGYAPGALVHHRVHPGDFRDWLREQRRVSMFPGLVRRSPGLRRKLRLRLFLSTESALFDLAVAGAAYAAVARRPWTLLAGLPWLWRRWRDTTRRPGRPRPVRLAQLALGDLVTLGSLLVGSVRHRRVIL